MTFVVDVRAHPFVKPSQDYVFSSCNLGLMASLSMGGGQGLEWRVFTDFNPRSIWADLCADLQRPLTTLLVKKDGTSVT